MVSSTGLKKNWKNLAILWNTLQDVGKEGKLLKSHLRIDLPSNCNQKSENHTFHMPSKELVRYWSTCALSTIKKSHFITFKSTINFLSQKQTWMTFSKEPSFPNSFSLPSLPCFSKTVPFPWPRPWQPPKPSDSARSVLLWGPWHHCCWSIPEATKGLLQRCHHWGKTHQGQTCWIQSWGGYRISLKVVFFAVGF